jgi:5-methylcytosine-specific restriction endonuclease McrA
VSKLTWDHIVPRCKGGDSSWANTITACKKCNNKKGDKDLEVSGLKLHYLPYVPKNFWDFKLRDEKLIEEWWDYLPG